MTTGCGAYAAHAASQRAILWAPPGLRLEHAAGDALRFTSSRQQHLLCGSLRHCGDVCLEREMRDAPSNVQEASGALPPRVHDGPCSIIDICLRLKSGACAEGIDQIGLSLEDLGRDPQVLRIVLVWLSSQLRSPVRDDAAALKEAARSGTIDSPGVDADDCPWDKRIPAHIRLRSREQADKVGDGAPLESPLALDRCEEALALCKDATDVYVASDFILGVDEGHGQQDAEHVQSDADAD
jgi:hypothetical protein